MAFARLLFLVLAAAMLTAAVSYAPPVWEGHFYRDTGMGGGGGCVTVSDTLWAKDNGACLQRVGDAPIALEQTVSSDLLTKAKSAYRGSCATFRALGCGAAQLTDLHLMLDVDSRGYAQIATGSARGTANLGANFPYVTPINLAGQWRVTGSVESECPSGRHYDVTCRDGRCMAQLSGTMRLIYPSAERCMMD